MAGFDIDSLSIEQKIGQLFFIGLPGPELDESTQNLLAEIRPGGICLFARNIKSLEQTRQLLDSVHDAVKVAPLLSIDQEGGRVDRLRRVMTPMPAANQLRSTDDAAELGAIVGEALNLLGFNMNFAPVVDVVDGNRESLSNGLQSRGLCGGKVEVAKMASAFLDGLNKKGILGCAKHFPGLAAAEVDSHEELPIVEVSDDELESTDLHPYRKLFAEYPNLSVMVAHAAYPNTRLQESDVNGNLLPSSLSRRIVTTLLRDELNFKGVSITDDMEMGAIVRNYGMGAACVMAINAGQDMIAICASSEAIRGGYNAVRNAVETGEIAGERIDETLNRILELKSRISERVPFSETRLAELSGRIEKLNRHLN